MSTNDIRSCVVCGDKFGTLDPEVWWCSEEHREVLANRAAARAGLPPPEHLAARTTSLSEAQRARDALGALRPKMDAVEREQLGAATYPPGTTPPDELLLVASEVLGLAARVTGLEEARQLALLAHDYTQRALRLLA